MELTKPSAGELPQLDRQMWEAKAKWLYLMAEVDRLSPEVPGALIPQAGFSRVWLAREERKEVYANYKSALQKYEEALKRST